MENAYTYMIKDTFCNFIAIPHKAVRSFVLWIKVWSDWLFRVEYHRQVQKMYPPWGHSNFVIHQNYDCRWIVFDQGFDLESNWHWLYSNKENNNCNDNNWQNWKSDNICKKKT